MKVLLVLEADAFVLLFFLFLFFLLMRKAFVAGMIKALSFEMMSIDNMAFLVSLLLWRVLIVKLLCVNANTKMDYDNDY